jgi:hypothetical protein
MTVALPDYEEILRVLFEWDRLGVLFVGDDASLRGLPEMITSTGRGAFFVELAGMGKESDLVHALLDLVMPAESSSPPPDIYEAASVIASAADSSRVPVLILDGLDQAQRPIEISQAIAALSRGPLDWKIVVSCSPELARRAPITGFTVVYAEQGAEAEDSSASTATPISPPAEPGPPSARVHADRWTTEDRLDYALYAKAISEFIRHPDAKPPMVISVQAPWGQGKTSLMRMVQTNLDPDHPDLSATKRDRPLVSDDEPESTITFRELEESLDGSVKLEPSTPPSVPTVWFNAWKYQSSEQIWAGLAHAILAQLTARLKPADRERFWLKLQLRRIDPAAVRSDIHKAVLEKLVPWLAGAVVLAVSLLVVGAAVLVGGPRTAGALIGAGGVLGGLATTVFGWVRATRKALDRNLEGAYLRYVQQPDYSSKLGFLHLVEQDMGRALNLLTPEDQPAVIFIDDLDRCSPAKIAEVIEAVNLFLAGDYPNCAFVIGIDAEVVAASMEVVHADIIDKLKERRGELGWRFMDKFVQLPFVMPRLHPTQREAYLRGLFASIDSHDAGELEAEAQRLEDQAGELTADELARRVGDLAPKLAVVAPDRARALGEAVVSAGASEFSDSGLEVTEALAAQIKHLSDNPRTIKRAVNLYRFHRFVAFARQASTLPLDVATPEQIGRWIVVIIRWPHFVRWMQAQREDEDSDGSEMVTGVLQIARRSGSAVQLQKALAEYGLDSAWTSDLELLEFLRDDSDPNLALDLAAACGLW